MNTGWKHRYLFALAALILFTLPALVHGQIRLPEGTAVTVTLQQDVSSKYAKPGDEVPIKLQDPIEVGSVVLVKAGASGTARVKSVETSGSGGKAGKIELELVGLTSKGNYTALEDKQILLKASANDEGVISAKGKGKGWFPWLFLKLFLKGGSAVIKAGTPIPAVTTESVFVNPAE
jgi:hypothetical protein